MYTILEDGKWYPFEHGTSDERVTYIEVACNHPANVRFHKHASKSGDRIMLLIDGGTHIIAHSVMFPDGRVWDSTLRTLEQVYEAWKPTETA